MSYGSIKTFTVVVASGASTSSDVDLGGRAWARIGLRIGSMSTAANISIQNSIDSGLTFYNVYHQTTNSSTVATPQIFISGTVGSVGGYCALPTGTPLNRVRFLTTAVVSGGVSFTLVCSD